MTLRFTRRSQRPAYVVESLTTHWRVRGDVYYRDAVVRFPDGRRELRAIREDLLGVAA